MNPIKRHPILLIVAIIVIGTTAVTVKTWMDNQSQQGASRWGGGSTIVVTQSAHMASIVDQVESIGTAKANESVLLTAKVSDTVRKVNFDDGDFVNEGDILVELTNVEQTAQLAEAKATVDEASRQFERLRNLIEQKLASETQLDAERVRMQTAQARFEAIAARLADRLVRAPFAGVLGFRTVSPGTLLTSATPVTSLDDISRIKLDFDIPENYLAIVKPGQEVTAISIAYPDRPFVGVVNTIDSRVDPVTRTVAVRALIKNEERLLRPGMLLTINLVFEREQALVIPEEAIIPVQDRQFVYTIDDKGFAQQIKVTTGRRRPGIVEVLSGLAEGDEVITQGAIKIRPGSPVTKRGQASPAGPGRGPGSAPPRGPS